MISKDFFSIGGTSFFKEEFSRNGSKCLLPTDSRFLGVDQKYRRRREGVRIGATVKVNTTVTFLFDRSVNEHVSARMVRGSRAASNRSD